MDIQIDISPHYYYNLSHIYSTHNTHITYNDNMHSLQRAGQDGSGICSHKGQTKPSIYFLAHKLLGMALPRGQTRDKSRKCLIGLSTPTSVCLHHKEEYKPSPVPCTFHHSVYAWDLSSQGLLSHSLLEKLVCSA